MAKVKITTKACPLCGYIYERMQKYEKKEMPCLSFYKDAKKTRLVEECTEDTVIKGEQDFEYVYHKDDPMNERYGGDPIVIERDCIGMFCPKCGIFLNDNICTRYNETEI